LTVKMNFNIPYISIFSIPRSFLALGYEVTELAISIARCWLPCCLSTILSDVSSGVAITAAESSVVALIPVQLLRRCLLWLVQTDTSKRTENLHWIFAASDPGLIPQILCRYSLDHLVNQFVRFNVDAAC